MFLRPGGVRAAETVAERLNDGDSFFPLKDNDGRVVLLGKGQVRYVVTPSADEDDQLAEERNSSPQLLVTVELDSGEAVAGVFFVDMPPGHVRALDYVNCANRPFVLLAQLDRDYVINRHFITQIRDMKL
jgi:hypothetical protein